MRLLLTRPRTSNDRLAALLREHGHQVSLEPLLTLEFLPLGTVDCSVLQAVVATSSNALRAIGPGSELVKLPLYAVGAATARTGREKGFASVEAGQAGARELAALLTARLRPGAGSILYLRGEDIAFDLETSLRSAGFNVESRKVYRAVPAGELSAAALSGLAGGKIDGVVLLSPRTTETYVHLARQAGLLERVRTLAHFCLSQRVAEPLARIEVNVIRVPARPTSQELVALVDLSATQSPPST